MSTGSNETASVVSMYESKKANKEAMNQQNLWNALNMSEQQKMYNQNRADLKPYTEAGYKSLAEIQALMGQTDIPTRFYSPEEQARKTELEAQIKKSDGEFWNQSQNTKLKKELAGLGRDYTPEEQVQLRKDAQTAAMSRFRTDPGYEFAMNQGLQARDRSAMKGGGLFSGRQAMALNDYGQGMANQQFGNYYNRLWNTANMGRGTAVGVADMGTNYANSMGNLYNNASNISSRRIYGDAQATSQMASTIGANQQEGFNTAINTASSLYGGGMLSGGGSSGKSLKSSDWSGSSDDMFLDNRP